MPPEQRCGFFAFSRESFFGWWRWYSPCPLAPPPFDLLLSCNPQLPLRSPSHARPCSRRPRFRPLTPRRLLPLPPPGRLLLLLRWIPHLWHRTRLLPRPPSRIRRSSLIGAPKGTHFANLQLVRLLSSLHPPRSSLRSLVPSMSLSSSLAPCFSSSLPSLPSSA